LVPQPPQFLSSNQVSTHCPPQSAYPLSHMTAQEPWLQLTLPFAGAAQTVPHAPQFEMSLLKSTQAFLQALRPVLQLKPHVPV
jgi:hypothetical protein